MAKDEKKTITVNGVEHNVDDLNIENHRDQAMQNICDHTGGKYFS